MLIQKIIKNSLNFYLNKSVKNNLKIMSAIKDNSSIIEPLKLPEQQNGNVQIENALEEYTRIQTRL